MKILNGIKQKLFLDEKGTVLGTTAVVALVVVLLSATIVTSLATEGINTQRFIRMGKALHLAEAGVERAIWEIKHDAGDFNGWSGSSPFKKVEPVKNQSNEKVGDLIVKVWDMGSNRYRIFSKSYVPGFNDAKSAKEVRVELEFLDFPPYALFANNRITINSNVRVDSYDSSQGSYGGSNRGAFSKIATNSTSSSPPAIELDGNADVSGTGYVGPGGDVDTAIVTNNSSSIDSESTLVNTVPLPLLSPPSLSDKGSFFLDGTESATIDSDGKYSSFKLDNNSELTFTNDAVIHVTGEVNMLSNSRINIEDGAQVIIYVDGGMFFDSNTDIVNQNTNPESFYLIGTGELTDSDQGEPGINFDSNTDMTGIIYSPSATVDVDSNAEISGAIIAQNIHLDSNVRIHYDVELDNNDSGPFGYVMKSGSWVEKGIALSAPKNDN